MKKNKSNLLIPLAVVVVLVVVLGGVLLKDNILNLFKPKDTYVRVEGYPKVIESTKKVEKVRRIVKSQDEFKALMKELFDDENKISMPENDFNKTNFYIVTTETNDTEGFKVRVRALTKVDETNYDATIERQKPGKTCVNNAKPNVAIDVVKIEKIIATVDADKVDKVIDCK